MPCTFTAPAPRECRFPDTPFEGGSVARFVVHALQQYGVYRVDGLSLEDPRGTLGRFCDKIGKTVTYFGEPEIMDLKPKAGFIGASYAGTGEFARHTDISYGNPPRYLAIFCISPDRLGGGQSLIVDSRRVVAELTDAERLFLERTNFEFPPPPHVKDVQPFVGPVLSADGRVRFRFDLSNADLPGPVKRFSELADKHTEVVTLEPGTLYVFDNHRFLHGRTEIRDPNRWLLRQYIDDGT